MKLAKLAVVVLLGVMLVAGMGCGGGQGTGPAPTGRSSGPIQNTDFLTYNATTNKVEMKYDLNLSQYWSEIVPPPGGCYTNGVSQANVCQAGDPTIMYNSADSSYYIVYRVKRPPMRGLDMDDVRMKFLVMIKSSDLENWTEVWNYSKREVADVALESVEMSSLIEHDGRYYLYFAHDLEGESWNNSYIEAKSPAGLGARFIDYSKWHTISYPGISKMPGKHTAILHYNDTWYEMKNYLSENTYGIMESSNISGPWVNSSNPGRLYADAYEYKPKPDSIKQGTVVHDTTTNHFILWGTSYHNPESISYLYWWWAVSPDMHNWTYIGRRHINHGFSCGQWRFPGLAVSEDATVLVMQWDFDRDRDDSIVLWHFPEPSPQ